METVEEANAAIAKLNDSEVEGRKIVVNIARPREERPQRSFGGRGDNDRRPRDSSRGGSYRGGRNRY
jgi:hypothetical protein